MFKNNKPKSAISGVLLRGILYTVVIPLAVIAAVIGGIYLNSHIEVSNTQASMKEYLQKKYGQEFVVGKPERKGGGLAVEGRFESVAYPRANNNLKFRAMSSSTGLWDNYASKVWENRQTTEAKPIIDEILKDIPHAYNVEIDSSYENVDGCSCNCGTCSKYGAFCWGNRYVCEFGNLHEYHTCGIVEQR